MIRDLRELNRGGWYVGDFRYDEGVRIREDFISPCLTAHLGHETSLTSMIILVEVKDEEENLYVK